MSNSAPAADTATPETQELDAEPLTTATDFVSSIIRTIVPALAGWILSIVATLNLPFTMPASAETYVEGGLTFALAFVWYFIVRALEEKWPACGWLLGVAKKPVYTAALPPAS